MTVRASRAPGAGSAPTGSSRTSSTATGSDEPSDALDSHRRALAKRWAELIQTRVARRDSVKRQHGAGLANAADLSRAEQALTEARIGLAKAANDRRGAVTELSKLVALLEAAHARNRKLHETGALAEDEMLRSREAVLEARIRLVEAEIAKGQRTGL